jgi:hypothetical protein
MNIDEINKDINKATVQNILSFFNSADWSDNLNLDTERLLKDKSYVDDFYEKANSGDNKSQLIMFYVEMINNINSLDNDKSKAIDWLIKSSDNGLPEAQYILGEFKFMGYCVEKNELEGESLLEKSANNGITEAQLRMAELSEEKYEDGCGFRLVDYDEKNHWLEMAATPTALTQLADYFDSEKRYEKAFTNYSLVDKQDGGLPCFNRARYKLAEYYAKGCGRNKSIKTAVALYEKVAYSEMKDYDDYYIDYRFDSILILTVITLSYECGQYIDEYQLNKILKSFSREKIQNYIIEYANYNEYDIDSALDYYFNELSIIQEIIPNCVRAIKLAKTFILNNIEILKNERNIKVKNKNLEEVQQKLKETNKELEEKNKALDKYQYRMQKLVDQFTHSLGNVIFPDTIYQVMERLKNNSECRKDVLLLNEAYHSEIIIKLQGELLRQRYANTNSENFRILVRRCRRTQNTIENTKTIEDILDYAASRVTARFLNQHYAGLTSIRDKILSKKNVSLNTLQQKFEDDILLNKSLNPVAWINQNLRPIQIAEISPLWKKVFILSESHAEALLFGYFSEILFNAFKYADHDKDEFLRLVFDEKIINDKTYLSCSWQNPVKDKSPSMLGTGNGLDAIQEDLKQLNDTEKPEESLLIPKKKNQFQVTLFFKKDLLINKLPSLKIKRKTNVE